MHKHFVMWGSLKTVPFNCFKGSNQRHSSTQMQMAKHGRALLIVEYNTHESSGVWLYQQSRGRERSRGEKRGCLKKCPHTYRVG